MVVAWGGVGGKCGGVAWGGRWGVGCGSSNCGSCDGWVAVVAAVAGAAVVAVAAAVAVAAVAAAVMPREAQRGPESLREAQAKKWLVSAATHKLGSRILEGAQFLRKGVPLVAPSQTVASFISNSHIGKPYF